MRVRPAPRLAEPTLLLLDVGVIPPAAAAHGVADGHQAVQVILMDRAARHLRVVRLLGDVRPPVFLALGRHPLVDQRIRVLALVDEMGHPDVVVEARRLPGHFGGVKADGLRDLHVVIVAVAQAARLDARLARDQRAAVEDRVADLDQPGVRADALHVLRHVEHQPELVVRAEEAAGVVVAVLVGRQLAHLRLDDVAEDVGGVDDEVGAVQRGGPVGRLVEGQLRADLPAVARAKLVDHVQTFLVNVHVRDMAAGKALGQAQIFDEAEGELGAARADDGDFHVDCSWKF